MKIIKRDGRIVEFEGIKISNAIRKAFDAYYTPYSPFSNKERMDIIFDLTEKVVSKLAKKRRDDTERSFTVEEVQDIVENTLIASGYVDVAKKYIIYRSERNKVREMKTGLMQIYDELTKSSAKDSNIKRENANINAETAMGVMLKYGSEGAKKYNQLFVLKPEHSDAHINGDIHIHDLDFLTLTETCCQIDLIKLFKNGFSTGHGHVRKPNGILTYSALACIAIQANQNEQHGGQSIPNFDYAMSDGVRKTYAQKFYANLLKYVSIKRDVVISSQNDSINALKDRLKEIGITPAMSNSKEENGTIIKLVSEIFNFNEFDAEYVITKVREFSLTETDRETYQAMEALIHNLNTMHSRAGAQVPFSSINYGTDTTPEGRMVIKNILLAEKAGLGNGETPIFPIHIFKVKEGINYNTEDINYDMFKLACEVSARRLFPNFSFIDAPYNLKYYKPGDYNTEIAYMGCRTRVISNVYDPSREIVTGRGNLSFTSINLPRLGIENAGNVDKFFEELDKKIDLVIDQLLDRLRIQSMKTARNYPFLMGQGVWIDSDNLGPDDSIAEVLKHGSLSVGFIGLAECLKALVGFHHGEDKDARELGYKIIQHMRDRMDEAAEKTKLNFGLLATPAEGLSGRFVKIDKDKYGIIEGVTDKDYYTNSFHVPVYYNITAFEKIDIEAPFHEMTNAGHISYVEFDANASYNVEAFETVVRYMKEAGIGYGSINHPVDRDPVCGYTGILGTECPKCHRKDGEDGIKFERIRRITGYLVGTLDRFNDAKLAEVKDRVKHGLIEL